MTLRPGSLAVTLLVAGLVLAAIGLSAARLLLSQAVNYQTEIEQWMSRQLDQPLRIGSIRTGWHGLSPLLELKQVALLAPEGTGPGFNIGGLRLRLALIDSLLSGSLRLKQLTVSGIELQLQRAADGSLTAVGLERLMNQRRSAAGPIPLPTKVVLADGLVQWQDLAAEGAPLRFTNVNASLANRGRNHRLSVRLSLPGTADGRLELAADITGDVRRPAGWSGAIYAKASRLPLARLLQQLPAGYRLQQGQGSVELWSEWRRGRLHWLGGSGRLTSLDLLRQNGQRQADRRLQIDRLGGRFDWQRGAEGWQLNLRQIQLERTGLDWPAAGISVASRTDHQGRQRLTAGADFARIEDILAALRMSPAPNPSLQRAVAGVRPHGDLSDVQFRYADAAGGALWSLRGKIDSLHTSPWRRLPGVDNLSARFWLDQSRGVLQLHSRNSRLYFPRLFRDRLYLQQLQGRLTWQRQRDGSWRLDAPELLAANRDLTTRSRLHLSIPAEPEQSIVIDLQTDFRDGDAATTPAYLPVGIMKPKLVAWLEQSIHSGKVLEGSCILRGPLRGFPYHRDHSGRFEVFFKVDDLLLDYRTNWPALTGVAAEVRFLNNGFDAWIARGRIYQSRISRTHASIGNLRQAGPLVISARAEGDLQDPLRLLRESPLSDAFGKGAGQLQAGGGYHLDLALELPLKQGGQLQVDGDLRFDDARLDINAFQLPISSLRGNLQFDHKGAEASGIEGLVYGNRVRADVFRPAAVGSATRVVASGAMPAQTLARDLPPPLLRSLRGTSDWNLQLELPPLSAGGKAPVRLELRSDLVGTAIDQPLPLGKSAAEKRELLIALDLNPKTQRQLHIGYQPLIDAALVLAHDAAGGPGRLTAAGIRLGDGKASAPAEGLEIRGQLPELDLTHWHRWLDVLGSGGSTGPLPPIRLLQARIERLITGSTELKRLQLDLEHRNQALSGSISSDRFDGNLQLPDDLKNQPLVLSLQRLALEFAPDQEEQAKPAPKPALMPTELPALLLDIERLQINQQDFGALSLATGRLPNGLELKRLSVSGSKLLTASGEGEWVLASDASQRSAFNLSLQSGDLGKLITGLGYARSIDQAPMELAGELFWIGPPWQPETDALNGQVNVRLEQGRLLQVDPGLGGRAFGLLTVDDNMWRRLTLDFSDLFEKGFSFNKVRGDLLIAEGRAYAEDFKIKGPAARIDLTGWTDLNRETMDLLVTVTPRLSSTLPIAGALIINPAVGAALLLAQQLVGEEVDKVSQVEYRVTGPWTEPQVETVSFSTVPATTEQEQEESRQDLLFPPGD